MRNNEMKVEVQITSTFGLGRTIKSYWYNHIFPTPKIIVLGSWEIDQNIHRRVQRMSHEEVTSHCQFFGESK